MDQLIHVIRPDDRVSIRVAEKIGSTFAHRLDIDGGPVVAYAQHRPTEMLGFAAHCRGDVVIVAASSLVLAEWVAPAGSVLVHGVPLRRCRDPGGSAPRGTDAA